MKLHEQMELELYKDQLKKDEQILRVTYPFVAKMTKSYYDQLIESGFNPEQALRIVLMVIQLASIVVEITSRK